MQQESAVKESPKNLQLRQIGRGFIVCRKNPLMGHQLTNGYLDQHDKIYVLVNNNFEPLGDCQRFLVVA